MNNFLAKEKRQFLTGLIKPFCLEAWQNKLRTFPKS